MCVCVCVYAFILLTQKYFAFLLRSKLCVSVGV